MNKYLERGIAWLVCAAVLMSTTACSLFSSSTQGVTIIASDPAAEIYVDGALLGKGTVTASLSKRRTHAVMAKVEDRAATAHIGRTISATGVLDIVGGIIFLVPFLGVLGPGFFELEPSSVSLAIPPK